MEVFLALTDAGRRSGEGVALVLSAAVDEELAEGGVAVLPVDVVGEAAPLLVAFHPGVEADVASAGAVHARLLLVLARAQELPVVIGVWGQKKKSAMFERKQKSSGDRHAHSVRFRLGRLIADSRTKSWSKTFLTLFKGKPKVVGEKEMSSHFTFPGGSKASH